MNFKKTLRKLTRSLKKTFHKKKNKRKLLAATGVFLILTTSSALFLNNAHDNRQKLRLQHQVELTRQETLKKSQEAEQTKIKLHQTEQQKAETEKQLNETKNQKKDLEIQLQTKRRTTARLASAPTKPTRPATHVKPPAPKRVAGNTYTRCQCTYYAKSQRPDIPNNLGNANTWASRAAAQGFLVNSTPSIGAVAANKRYMHVAIVRSIGNGTVTIDEWNYAGPCKLTRRTTPISEWLYIH